MDKKKHKVNAKRFLEDYRSGISDRELMRLHGLDRVSLSKLLVVLQQRGLLSAGEARSETYPGSPARQSDLASDRHESADRSEPRPDPVTVEDSGFHCLQCGASIKGNMLTCPECGHVLPGEERWSNLGPGERFLPRVPPWVLGCLLALPIAIGLLLVFKHILIPLSSASIQQRTKSHGATVAARQQLQPAIDPAKSADRLPIHAETERLMGQAVLAGASPDYTSFTTSDGWHYLSRDEKIKHIIAMSSALRESGMSVQFTFLDSSGGWVARVAPQIMELRDKDGYTDTIDREDLAKEPVPAAEDRLEERLKNVEPRLPQTDTE